MTTRIIDILHQDYVGKNYYACRFLRYLCIAIDFYNNTISDKKIRSGLL